jgi:hypothetical protein
MGIFGQLDAQNIPTNPFFVEKGEYTAEVTKAHYKDNRDGQKQLVLEYTIDDTESPFFDSKVSQYFTLIDPNMTNETFMLLPPDEQKQIRRMMSALKRTLCGNDGNDSQRGLGVDPDDLNGENWDPETLKGLKVSVGVNNYGPNNEKVSVQWVNLR